MPRKKQTTLTEPESITMTFPLPSKYLNPNYKPQTKQAMYARARTVKKARTAAQLIAMQAMNDSEIKRFGWKNATLQATFYLPKRRDKDNLQGWIKAYQDGIQDAGVIKNDSGITPLAPQQVTGRAVRTRVEITVEREA